VAVLGKRERGQRRRDMVERTWWETVENKGGELLNRLKQLIAEGNVRRVVVKRARLIDVVSTGVPATSTNCTAAR
jgi:hypothetical protein